MNSNPCWEWMRMGGVWSRKYQSLLEHKDDLIAMIDGDAVTVLSDMEQEGLYPYKLLMDADDFRGSLHLIGASPFLFMGARRRGNYENLIWDNGKTRSAAILNTDHYLKGVDIKKTTMSEVFKNISDLLLKPVSALAGLEAEEAGSYNFYIYDFSREKYLPADRKEYIYYNRRPRMLAGIGPAPVTRNDIEEIPVPPPSPDGKELCRALKSARIQLAKANGIPFESPDCPSKAKCGGTCEACDQELVYLNREMEKIPEGQREYPKLL